MRLWDPDTGAELRTLTGHTSPVEAVCAFGRLGRPEPGPGQPPAATTDGAALGPRHRRRVCDTLTGHTGPVSAVCALPGAWADRSPALASAGGDDGTVRLWDPDTGAESAPPDRPHQPAVSAVWPSGTWADQSPVLASAGDDDTVRLWDPDTGAERRPLTGHTSRSRRWPSGAGPDQSPVLASAGHDGTVRLWDPDTGAESAHPDRPHQTGSRRWRLRAPADQSPVLASAGHDDTVRLWDPATGAAVGDPLTGHDSAVKAVACPAPGRPEPAAGLAPATTDTVRLWDPATGAESAPPTGHTAWSSAVALSGAGRSEPVLASPVMTNGAALGPHTGAGAPTAISWWAVCGSLCRRGSLLLLCGWTDGRGLACRSACSSSGTARYGL